MRTVVRSRNIHDDCEEPPSGEEAVREWCAVEGCQEPPVWTDPENGEQTCAGHVNYGCEDTPHTAELPSGQKVDLTLWLRVRAAILEPLEKAIQTFRQPGVTHPQLTDGILRDITDAACTGLVEHAYSDGFKSEYARWYASQVIAHLEETSDVKGSQ